MSDQYAPTESVLIAQFEKNKKNEVRVSVDTFDDGKKHINLRTFYKDENGVMKPGKGLSVSVELYKDLASAIVAVGQHLKSLGLL
jgi:hypothetical protein